MVHVFMYVPLHVGLRDMWCLGSREGGCGLVVEDVRDTWDGVGNTAVVTKATPNGCVIG